MLADDIINWVIERKIEPLAKKTQKVFMGTLMHQPDVFASWVRTQISSWLKEAAAELKKELSQVDTSLATDIVMRSIALRFLAA